MLTLVVSLSPALARRVAQTADALELTHDQVGQVAVREFVKAFAVVQPKARARGARAARGRKYARYD